MSHHNERVAAVMAHRSPRGKRPPETEIPSIILILSSTRNTGFAGRYSIYFLLRKVQARMSAPTGKWGKCRSAKFATSCGKADMTRVVRAKEAAPQPPRLFLI